MYIYRSNCLLPAGCGLVLVQELRAELNLTSQFMRDVICELLLRDTEYLLDRYMRKMRKSFSRMYWDDEIGEEK